MVSRREILKRSLALGASVGAGSLLGCNGDVISPVDGVPGGSDGGLEPGPFDADHAVATFEANRDSALVSIWAAGPRGAMVVVEDAQGMQTLTETVELRDDRGRTSTIVITGLAAGASYRYHVRFDTGETTDWYAFRTAPAFHAEPDLHLLFSADIDFDPMYETEIFDTMTGSGADFFVCLGDWPYTDNGGAAQSIGEFRDRHRAARRLVAMQDLLRVMGVYAIYDDHEVFDDWDASYREENPDVVSNALTVWDEWFPLREAPIRYRSVRWGQHAELFILDTRLYRSANADVDDENKTMLGSVQKAWLLDGLRGSDATFKLVVTSVPLDFGTNADHWAQFTTERDEILGVIASEPVDNVVFLTADQHWFAAHHHAGGLREFQVGPLKRTLRTPPPPVTGVVAVAEVFNYGELLITGGTPPRLVFNCRDPDGVVVYTETISATVSGTPTISSRETKG